MNRVLVCLKRVVDFSVRIHVAADGSGIHTDGLKMSINPFDEIALEEALRIRERGQADEVVIASIGTNSVIQQLRNGLAMGADRAVLVETARELEPLAIASILRALVRREEPRLVLTGKQSIDGDNNQTGQMLAALWERPQACFASSLELSGEKARVTREVDAGMETIEIDLPAVVTTDLRLNEPRYVRLPDILKAKKKPLETIPLENILADAPNIPVDNQFSIVATNPPAARPKGRRLDTVADLVAELGQRGLLTE